MVSGKNTSRLMLSCCNLKALHRLELVIALTSCFVSETEAVFQTSDFLLYTLVQDTYCLVC